MSLRSLLKIDGSGLTAALTFVLALGLFPATVLASGGGEDPTTATITATESGSVTSFFSSIGQRLGIGASDDTFLQPEQAFPFSAEIKDPYTITAYWEILDGYYLYRDKFSFVLQDADGVEVANVDIPRGKEKHDESFGLMEVFYHEVSIDIALQRTNKAATDLTLVAKYQGCADAGFCYPPMKQAVALSLPEAVMPAPVATTSPGGSGFVSEQDQLAQSLSQNSIALSMLSFFGLGLLLTFTPCVFPMIPILSSIIAGQGSNITTRRAFSLSLVYVMAMALTYTVAGVLAGLFGGNLQAAFQNPWILGSFSALFVLLSLSMFGFYELQLPSRFQSKLTEVSNKQRGGTVTGVAIMGFLSALIVGPCVAAPLAGALIYIGQTGDAVLGGAALFALSLGMGAPLLLIGTSAGKFLPKAGPWMDAIKAVFGVLLLAVAIWMLERIIPGAIALALWAALFIISAIYLGALENLKPEASGWQRLWKGFGVVMLIYGATLLIGSVSGGRDLFQPLAGLSVAQANGGAGAPSKAHLEFEQIKGLDGLNQALARAKRNNQHVMLDFYADWCISCKEMEASTFSDPGVKQALDNVMLIQADVTDNDAQDQALLKHFGLIGPPTILLFTPAGEELRQYRLVGFLGPDDFESLIRTALN